MTVKTFIDRPVLAGVISVIIVILGILGLVQLPYSSSFLFSSYFFSISMKK